MGSRLMSESLSTGTPAYSSEIKLSPRAGFAIGIEWTSTLEATVVLQLGIDKPDEHGGGTFWFDTAEVFPDVPEGTAGSSGQSWGDMNADRVRLKVTRTESSGTFTAWGTWK